MKKVGICIRVSADLHQQVMETCRAQGRTLAETVTDFFYTVVGVSSTVLDTPPKGVVNVYPIHPPPALRRRRL